MQNLIWPLTLTMMLFTARAEEKREGGWPRIMLTKDELQLEIAVPNQESGYYRSCRFDWSGVIYEARWKGIPIFGEFHQPRDPAKPDSISGTAEEFDSEGPSTYGSEGDEFLKIGVGVLRKNSGNAYANNTNYDFIDRGEWKVTHGKDWAEFTHRAGPLRGNAYELTKRIVLGPLPGVFTIERSLHNVGTTELLTEHYGHHFFRIADDPIGRNYQVSLPENCPLQRLGGTASPIRVVRGTCVFLRDLDPNEYAQFGVGYAGKGDFSISNLRAGLEVEVTSTAATKRFVLFATSRTLCPELFTDIKLAPGERFSWSTRYQVRSHGLQVR